MEAFLPDAVKAILLVLLAIAFALAWLARASMFNRYDIASTDDKLEGLRRAQTHVLENARFSSGLLVAVQGFEPRTQRI